MLEPTEVTRWQMDPFHVNLRDSGPEVVSILLEHVQEGPISDRLQITLKLKDENPTQMAIHIRFGKHYFSTSLLGEQF